MRIKCKILTKRKSVRFFNKVKKLDYYDILGCVEAAMLAPSAHNVQPWRFKIIDSDEIISQISSVLKNNQWIITAPALVLVGMKKSEKIDDIKNYMAVGAAIQNLLLEAQYRGISTCWVGECLNISMDSFLEWPVDLKLVAIVAMGFERVLL